MKSPTSLFKHQILQDLGIIHNIQAIENVKSLIFSNDQRVFP